MQVTFTNASGDDLFLSQLYRNLAAGESLTTSRTPLDIDGDQALKALIEAGDITISAVTEAGDTIYFARIAGSDALVPLAVYDDAGRPDPTAVPAGTAIFNSDDGFPNYSDGTNWVDAAGVTT
jgi:hypothetical protein